MNFKPKCMFCGNEYTAADYSCSCKNDKNESWTRRYRSIDLEIEASAFKDEAVASFANYDFNDEAGMLQYGLLSNRDQKVEKTAGLTPLHRLSNFSRRDEQLFLKDEGRNPSGCFKDRETVMCLLHSKAEKLKKSVVYSSGNAAASAAIMVEGSPRRLITFVPGDTYPEKIEYIRNHGSHVIVIGDESTTFEEGYRLFSDMNAAHIFADNGFDNWSVRNPYRVQGDKTIAVEIVKQLSRQAESMGVPDYVIVPTANGSCLTGIWKGFKELYETGIINKLPKMVSAGIKNASPVYKAVQKNKTDQPVRCDLSKTDKDDADVGSIILAEEGYDSIKAAEAVIESGGTAVELHASDIQRTLIKFLEEESELALQHNVLPEPAAVTSLAALEKLENNASSYGENITVSIATGHGLKAREKIAELLEEKPAIQVAAEQILSKREKNMATPKAENGTKVTAEADLASVLEAFFELHKSYRNEPVVQPI